MGIIFAGIEAVRGGFADEWLEVIEPDDMGEQTVVTVGVKKRKGQNVKGTDHSISNGSIIHVYDNQCMILVDGGKIIDFSSEPGYYKVDNSSMPSIFSKGLKESVKETFSRIKFGGVTPFKQVVYYINLQEIKGIKFGTRNPVNYFDSFYNAELFLRAHGNYSIKITDPLLFYAQVVPRNSTTVEIDDINEQYMSEFLEALQALINQMSAEGIRISYVASKSRELSKYMSDVLDEDWSKARGIEVQSVGIASISYDESSQKLIQMRNEGAMLSDPSLREGYVQGAMARGVEAAGSNANGAMSGFMGVGLGMQASGNQVSSMSATNLEQMKMQQNNKTTNASIGKEASQEEEKSWICPNCQTQNTGRFCSECGTKKQEEQIWICPNCQTQNTGKFCSECGTKKEEGVWTCPNCQTQNTGKFCSECGTSR